MERRRLLALTGGSAALALSGCAELVGDGDDDSDDRPALTGSVAGRTASVQGIEESVPAELDVAAALETDPAYVRARAGGSVEVLTDGISASALQSKLTGAGYEVQDTSDGITEQTREAIVEALQAQLDAAGVDGEVRFADGSVLVEADDDSVAAELTTDPETVAIDLSYPDPETGEQRRETVLTGADVAEVAGVQTRGTGDPRVQVRLTESAGERFATRLIEADFTDGGTNACEFDPDSEDEPPTDQYCILTATDGDVVHGASLNADLANTMESGGFAANPSFVVTTGGDRAQAEDLADVLRAGLPPARVELEQ